MKTLLPGPILFLLLFFAWGCSPDGEANVDADQWLSKAYSCLELEDFSRAVNFYSKALDLDPVNKEARYGISLSRFGLAREFGSGIRFSEDSNLVQEHWNLWVQSEAEFIKAEKAGLDSGGMNSWSDLLFHEARFLYRHQKELSAVNYLNRSLEKNPKNTFSLNLLGTIFFELGDREKAMGLFYQVIELDSTFEAAYHNLGSLHYQSGEIEDSYVWYVKGSKHIPNSSLLKYWSLKLEEELLFGDDSVEEEW